LGAWTRRIAIALDGLARVPARPKPRRL
jgi:hypothetical protein